MVLFLKVPVNSNKRILKIKKSWPELFDFQSSFNSNFKDGMNGIYLYFVNKPLSSWSLLGL